MPPKCDKGKSAKAGGSKHADEPNLTRKEILTIGVRKRGREEEENADEEEEEQDRDDERCRTDGVQDDWRRELRSEIDGLRTELGDTIQRAVSNAVRRQVQTSAPAVADVTEVDSSQIISQDMLDAVKQMEASNRSNKYAIRLTGITKEGNKQQFTDMIEMRESLEKVEAALKSPELAWDDIFAARDALAETFKFVDDRMAMIERIDKHPLSWPVATEFQRLKRAKTGDAEDEKLFQQAEKKVEADRKKREETAAAQRASTSKNNDRFHFSKKPGKTKQLAALFFSG